MVLTSGTTSYIDLDQEYEWPFKARPQWKPGSQDRKDISSEFGNHFLALRL